MNTTRYWIHCNLATGAAHVLSVADPLPATVKNEADVSGYAYRNLPEVQEFLCWTMSVDHSDADAFVMAAEMQGKDDLWFSIQEDHFNEVVGMGPILNCDRRPIQGYRVDGGQAFANTDDDEVVEISESLES